MDYKDAATFRANALAEYTVGGTSYGQFKTAGNVSSSGVPDAVIFPFLLTFD